MNRTLYLAAVAALAATLSLPTDSFAQALWSPSVPENAPPPADVPDRVPMTVSAAAEPVPALEYRLLPTTQERTPGNAATYYYRAMLHLKSIPQDYFKKYAESQERWTEKPLDGESAEEIRKYLEAFPNVFSETKTAVYREECEWNLGLEQLKGPETISFLLHDFQEMREITRLLELRFRLELYENRLDDAWETLRQLTQLGRDSAQPTLLINGLIGIAIESIMLGRLEDFISHPEAPNVYWALATLPDPLVDLAPSVEFEATIGPRMFPMLEEAERSRTPEQWQADLQEAWNSLRYMGASTSMGMGNDSGQPSLAEGAAALGYAMTRYPIAKSLLIESGRTSEEVDAMPVGQALLLAEKIAYRRVYDEMLKTYYLPLHVRVERGDEFQDRLEALMKEEPIPIAQLLLPAVQAVSHAQIRLVYRLRGIQAIEAIRDFAAEEGRLPRRLQEVRRLPMPVDPYTLENFGYEVTGQTATLRVIVPGSPQRGSSKIYELNLRQSD
ncbi:MAG TPA: hypothetical protein VGN57_09260 [Pirellulaceae bacterium]|jgi:hypothetical protein|nr:hypothetical protein [Pirellulaceae bacterium]